MRIRVEKLSDKMKKKIFCYSLGLILEKGKKTCTQMSKAIWGAHDFLYRAFHASDFVIKEIPNLLIHFANLKHKENAGWLIVDDTVISKIFSKIIVGVHDLYNSSLGRPDRGLCMIVLAWSNGLITIPLKLKFVFSRAIAGKHFKSKSELAQEMILDVLGKVRFKYLLADAHYSTKTKLLPFLVKHNIKFLMKITRSKIIKNKLCRYKIKEHHALRLKRNSRSAKVTAFLDDMFLNFVISKSKDKNGVYRTRYFVTNISFKSRECEKMYDGRWEIEEMFRTFKQSLGLQDCMARSIEKQTTHAYLIFFAYTFLQNKKLSKNFDNPEASVKWLAGLKLGSAMSSIKAFSRNFLCFA